jgi:pimeloyl-ACP methyl ester carboxylesterase
MGRFCLPLVGSMVLMGATGRSMMSEFGGGPSTVVPDSVRFYSGTTLLRGVLHLPVSVGPYPAVVFMHGGGRRFLNSEPNDFARMLVERGIAALVYDKRGIGESEGVWVDSDFEDFIGDAGAAIEFLGGRDDIRADRIGVVGFSEGGRLAPVVAVRYPVAVAISVSGPGVSPRETRLFALENSLLEAGITGVRLDRAMELWRDHFEMLLAGRPPQPLDSAIFAALADLPAQALPTPSEYYTTDPFHNSLHFDPEPDLRRLSVPFLSLLGDRDVVVPVERSAQNLTRIFESVGNERAEIVILPGATHALDSPPGTRHPDYVPTVMSWLDRFLGPGSR